MQKPLITVVVPLYNVSQYLTECLDSIKAQTYENFEALLVNDGSTDGSDVICEKYCAEDSRFVYLPKENGGVADARNYGLDHAKGDYICFVDSDDYVTSEYLMYLYELVKDSDAGISACNHWICRDGRRTPNAEITEASVILSTEEAFRQVLYHGIADVSLWGKLYERRIFNSIRFRSKRIFEDTDMFAPILKNGNGFIYGSEPQYFYRIRESSITTTGFDSRKFQYIEAADHMCEEILMDYPQLDAACNRRRVHARISTLRFMQYAEGYAEQKKQIIRFIRKNGRRVLSDRSAPKVDKLAILSLYFGEKTFHLAWKCYCRMTGRAV